jgi:hypothetical protein
MIPLVAVVSLRNEDSRTFRFWIPLGLIWILLLPVAVLLSPLIFVACLFCRVNPFRAFGLLWQILCAWARRGLSWSARPRGCRFTSCSGSPGALEAG